MSTEYRDLVLDSAMVDEGAPGTETSISNVQPEELLESIDNERRLLSTHRERARIGSFFSRGAGGPVYYSVDLEELRTRRSLEDRKPFDLGPFYN